MSQTFVVQEGGGKNIRSTRGSMIKLQQKKNIQQINTLQGVDQGIVDTLIRAKQTVHGSFGLGNYVRDHLREHPILAEIRNHAVKSGALEAMQISVDEGATLQLLARMVHAKKCIDIGFFTGYSALAVALTFPEKKKKKADDNDDDDECVVVGIDINSDWAEIGLEFFEKANLSDKLDLRIDDGVKVLDDLLNDGQAGTYDFVFIDADKKNYHNYYEKSLQLLRVGGIIVVDNVFWCDKVHETKEYTDADTESIRELNDIMANDNRVELTFLPTADGVAVCYKK